ncbi:uncharacterized protein SRS1_02333 [Sporisorium reilianum f. sp. reilianum]|uniref:HNH nuclease domain-containing protein n=1 Tax=Sporisorium reilianum f. sp. reilianum TaxID=72559 RepID=A0A2N8UC93_9BASI|nr:uncharacterized protein SRS1_02333 [Sporisorium reilianum f. sp. reilianum]
MTSPSRPSSPDPFPRQPQASGALYGDLPLTLPRYRSNSHIVVIVSRENGVTSYEVRRKRDDEPDRCKIDTINEWILAGGVRIEDTDKKRVLRGGMAVAVLVAKQHPSPDPERQYVDHANSDALDNTVANLHWVTPAFNAWNKERKDKNGYFGVHRSGRNKATILVIFRSVGQGSYDNEKTAARVYDLVVRLGYKDQVDKTPHLPNNLPDPDKHVAKVASRADGVDIYRVDRYHLVIYDENVRSKHNSLAEVQTAAESFISDLEKKQAEQRQERQKKREELIKANAITRNADGVAFLPMRHREGSSVEVLLDDDTWLDLVAASLTLYPSFGYGPSVKIDGRTVFLNRYLRPAGNDIVDHVNGNALDHRLANREVRDRSANAQNSRRASRLFMGVTPTKAGGWIVLVKLKGKNRMVSKTFAAGELVKALRLYDLCALSQHGPSALINSPAKVGEYLAELEKTKTKEVEDFLAGRAKKSMYEGVGKHAGDDRSEVHAAIAADLWKLKTKGTEWRLNFEFMRPWYLFYLPQFDKKSEDEIVAKGYRRIGGDDFVRDTKTAVADPAALASPSAVASSSSAPSGSGTSVAALPSGSGKRKRDE